MPLDWLGQLKPTMEQQIALQRALLALVREDEELRAKTAEKAPALARGLGGAPVTPYAGPTPTLAGEKKEPSVTPSYFRPGAGSLEEALRAAQPSPEGVPTAQTEAWKRREEMVEERVVGAKDAYDHIITLDPAGQKIALDAVRKYKSAVYKAMETEGYISPTGVLSEPKKKVAFKATRITEGWEYEDITFEDGTTESRILGPAPEEAAVGPTISETIALEKLGMEMGEYAEKYRDQAIKIMGDMPRPGIDTITVEGEEVPVTAEHFNAWLQGVEMLTAYLSAQAGEAPPEGEPTMSKAQAEFEGSSGEVKLAIQGKLGVPQTGIWDEPTEFAFSTYGDVLLAEKPVTEKGEPSLEKRKGAWDEWLKKWGKTLKSFKGVSKAVKGVM